MFNTIDLWSWGLIIVRFFDGWKYFLQARKIRQVGTAKAHSRNAGNLTLFIDIYILLYFIFKNRDYYMIISTLVIILFVLYYWYTIYEFYSYRHRGLLNFKKPSILIYAINSILPNKLRKHL